MKQVAIITRTKDRPILLKRALMSVKQQKYKDYVWVIVNDGGEHKDVDQIVNEAKQEGIDVIVIHNEESFGMEAASNIGIKNSKSKYIVIHDDDDSWDERFLEVTIDFLEQEDNECYKGVVTQCYRIDEEIIDNKSCKMIRKYLFNNDLELIYFADMIRHNLYPPISFLYKREVYDQIGQYNEELPVLGDWDFNLKFMLYADIGVIEEPLANYHHRIQNNTVAYGNSVIQGINKHRKYDNLIRNKLLREDISNNKIGLGYLVNIGKYMDELALRGTIRGIKRVIKKQGVRGLLARLRNKEG